MADWYYAKDGQQAGPVSAAELKKMAAAGSLKPDDLVFQEGGTQWVEASTVKGLFGGTAAVAAAPAPAPSPAKARADRPERAERPERAAPKADRAAFDEMEEDDDEDRDLRRTRREGGKGFKTFFTPLIIVAYFWLGVVLMGIGATFSAGLTFLFAMRVGFDLGTAFSLFVTFASLAVGLILHRMACELILVAFRIKDTLEDIKMILKKQ